MVEYDSEECAPAGEVLCPALRGEVYDLLGELQKTRSFTGVLGFLLLALRYRVRVYVWYGTVREDVLESYAPWVSGSIRREIAVEAVACKVTRDEATGAKHLHLLGEDIQETNHWVACVRSGHCHGDGGGHALGGEDDDDATLTFAGTYLSLGRVILKTIADGDCLWDAACVMLRLSRTFAVHSL